MQIVMIGALLLSGAQGPLSKFLPADASKFASARSVSEVERCLIDAPGRFAPKVYRQVDRLEASTILWDNGAGVSIFRVDLVAAQGGTQVTAWKSDSQVKACI
jgi:hypothetical protein